MYAATRALGKWDFQKALSVIKSLDSKENFLEMLGTGAKFSFLIQWSSDEVSDIQTHGCISKMMIMEEIHADSFILVDREAANSCWE